MHAALATAAAQLHDEEEEKASRAEFVVATIERPVAVDAAESADEDVELLLLLLLLLLLRLVLPPPLPLLPLLLLPPPGGAKWLYPFGTAE
jgi:hypothetical protein